jgi:flagellar protein FliO/FliZ
MSGLLGNLMPIVVVVLVVAVAAGVAIFALRRFGAFGGRDSVRGPTSRLALVDSTSIIDGRKLVIVRRDNVEHLLLIGGATDVLVEANIGAAIAARAAAPRDLDHPARIAEPETPVRLGVEPVRTRVPEPEDAPPAETTKWPLQAEPARRARRGAEDGGLWPLRSPSDATTRTGGDEPRVSEPSPLAARSIEPEAPVAKPATASNDAREEAAAPTDHFAELAAALQRPLTEAVRAAEPRPTPLRPSAPAAPAAESAELTDMAHRLEAALRRPVSGSGSPISSARIEPRRPLTVPPAAPSQRLSPTSDSPRVLPRLTPETRPAPAVSESPAVSEPSPGSEPGAEPSLAADPLPAPEPRVMPEPRISSEPRVSTEPRMPAEPRVSLEPRVAPEPRVSLEPRVAPEPRISQEGRPASERSMQEPRLAPELRLTPEPKAEGGATDAPPFESLEREMASLLGRPPR